MSYDLILDLICYFIFDDMEYKIANAIFPPFELDFLRIIRETDDKIKLSKYLQLVYKLYCEYTWSILYNNFDMDGPDSGNNNNIADYKLQYENAKKYYCTSKTTGLYNIIKKYY
jgi:hypothetical protein